MVPPKVEQGFKEADFRIGASLLAAAAVYEALAQAMPGVSSCVNACVLLICVAFLADIDWKSTWGAGVTRVVVTFVGAGAGLVPVAVFDATGSEPALVLVFAAIAVCMIVLVKRTGKARLYVQCRIACVSYVLVVFTFHGAQYAAAGLSGYGFCLMWVLSTLLGVGISVAVAFAWDGAKGLWRRVRGRAG